MRVMNLLRSAGYLKLALVGLEDANAQPAVAPSSAPAAGVPTPQAPQP
jgi:biopolymer transport protein ExbD